MSRRSNAFVKRWVQRHVQNVEGVEDYRDEVARLCAALVSDAEKSEIDADELDETVGDLEEFMMDAYEAMINYDLGFKD